MKTIFKAIIAFFVSIWVFFFGKKVSNTHEEVKAVFTEAKGESVPEVRWGNRRRIPQHNNRKNTRGRYTQHIVETDGTSRPIFHDVQN